MTSRDRYVLCFGVVFVSIATIAGRGAPALTRWNARQQSEAAASAGELLRARSAVASFPAVRDSLVSASHRLSALEGRVVTGRTPADAASALADIVSDIADDASIKISTIELHVDSVTTASMRVVSVRLTGITDVTGLADFLIAIDTLDTLMTVRELMVNQGEPAAPATQAEALRVEIAVAALARLTRAMAK